MSRAEMNQQLLDQTHKHPRIVLKARASATDVTWTAMREACGCHCDRPDLLGDLEK